MLSFPSWRAKEWTSRLELTENSLKNFKARQFHNNCAVTNGELLDAFRRAYLVPALLIILVLWLGGLDISSGINYDV